MYAFILKGKAKEVFSTIRFMAYVELLSTTIPYQVDEDYLELVVSVN